MSNLSYLKLGINLSFFLFRSVLFVKHLPETNEELNWMSYVVTRNVNRWNQVKQSKVGCRFISYLVLTKLVYLQRHLYAPKNMKYSISWA